MWSGNVAVWSGNVVIVKSDIICKLKKDRRSAQTNVILWESLFFEQKAERTISRCRYQMLMIDVPEFFLIMVRQYLTMMFQHSKRLLRRDFDLDES